MCLTLHGPARKSIPTSERVEMGSESILILNNQNKQYHYNQVLPRMINSALAKYGSLDVCFLMATPLV